MRLTRLILLPVVCVLLLAGGCVYDDLSSEMVVTEKIVVQYNDYRESPDICCSVADARWRTRLLDALDKHGAELSDIQSITMVGGLYKVARPPKSSHDWTVEGTVTIERQDDASLPPTDGPATFVNFTTQSLKGAKSKPVRADLNSAGVDVVDRALQAILNGEDPRMVVRMVSDDITPAPSPTDPLDFMWLAEVEFQIVIDVSM